MHVLPQCITAIPFIGAVQLVLPLPRNQSLDQIDCDITGL